MGKPEKDQDELGEAADPAPIPFAEFLEQKPPSEMLTVSDLLRIDRSGGIDAFHLTTPELLLHCSNDTCNGYRIFRYKDGYTFVGRESGDFKLSYLTYLCSNCRSTTKIFSIYAEITDPPSGRVYKFGEFPPFGPPTPSRLLRLFGSHRALFFKGRRCENQGLGIGAFTYYRRVVENQKNQIFDEIIRVSEKIGASEALINELKAAKNENQFSKAVTSLKEAIPQALLINGHNPLLLLHAALSQGVHDLSDEKCLELAQDVRVVLADFAERAGQALKDEAELNTAVSRLLNARSDNAKQAY